MPRHHYETLQQVFDDAYRGLAAQGWRKSASETDRCAYRGKDGLRCAIGHCIPDADYDPKIEFASVWVGAGGNDIAPDGARYPEAKQLFARLFAGLDRGALSRLQAAHDYAVSCAERKTKFDNFAVQNGLTIPSIEGAA